jgi:NTE family protein
VSKLLSDVLSAVSLLSMLQTRFARPGHFANRRDPYPATKLGSHSVAISKLNRVRALGLQLAAMWVRLRSRVALALVYSLEAFPRAGIAAAIFAVPLCGCVPTTTDTVALSQAALGPPQSGRISSDGYRLESMPDTGHAPDLLVLVAMSGGGKRSAAYGYGALKGMREVPVSGAYGRRTLLDSLDGISGVSGGSFTATYYGLYRDAAFGRYENDFLYADTDGQIKSVYLLPWNWGWAVDSDVGTNDYMERYYDETMFHGARFKDLKVRGRPIIGISATDINYGTPFVFTQEFFDILCSDLEPFPIARAVAASNGFPGLFSSISLTNRAADCGGRKPGWLRRVSDTDRHNPLSRLGVQANMIERYLDPNKTRYVHLVDGGVSDNLGLRVAGGMMENLAESPAAISALGYARLRRILVLSIDGEGGQDPSLAKTKEVGGLLSSLLRASGGQIDRYNFETLRAVNEQLQDVVQAVRTARCQSGRTIDGMPCDDVKGQLIHISLAAMPAGPEKDKLLAIPTGLTIDRADVDRLVEAGRVAIMSSEPLRLFLQDYSHRRSPVIAHR